VKLAPGFVAVALAAALVLGGVAGAAGSLTIAPERVLFTVPHCTLANGDYGCPDYAHVAFRVQAPANTSGGVVSCAYNRDQEKALAEFIKGIPGGKQSTNLHCAIDASIADGEPTEGLAAPGAHVAQGYVWNPGAGETLLKSNAVHFTVTDECKLTVVRGFARTPPQATIRAGQPFPCAGHLPADQLKLRSAFGDTFDLHGCAYLTNRSAQPRYVYNELALVGGSRATPESHCQTRGHLRPGSLTLSTARGGFARGPLAISANWGVVFLPNAPTKIVLTYDDSRTTLHVVRGSAVLGARTFNEKRDGPALYGTKDAAGSCHPLRSACVLRAYLHRFKRTRLLHAGQTSTTAHGSVPTPPR
jgi:hypothetical protein